MTRDTSRDAYYAIKEDGLLSKRRMEVYEYLYKQGPSTCRDVVMGLKGPTGQITSFSPRFAELRDRGAIEEVGSAVDPETNQTVIVWAVTNRLPKEPEAVRRVKCVHCNGKGFTQQVCK